MQRIKPCCPQPPKWLLLLLALWVTLLSFCVGSWVFPFSLDHWGINLPEEDGSLWYTPMKWSGIMR